MEAGWLGYLFGAFCFIGAYRMWKDPFHVFSDIDDWDGVTDENRSQFNQKRLGYGVVSCVLGLILIADAERFTSIFFAPKTMSDYDCEDVAESVKTSEFRNGFGAITKVVVVLDSVEIERTDTKFSCQMTALLSTDKEVSMTASYENIDGELYMRSSIND